MGRLRLLSGQETAAILRANGFELVRRRGSHMVMQKKLEGTTITVPIPDHKTLRRGTLRSIVRQSQLPRALFEES